MLKQNQESQSSAGAGISEGCEGHFQYINMEGTVSKMWAPLHVVGNLVTEDREMTEEDTHCCLCFRFQLERSVLRALGMVWAVSAIPRTSE